MMFPATASLCTVTTSDESILPGQSARAATRALPGDEREHVVFD